MVGVDLARMVQVLDLDVDLPFYSPKEGFWNRSYRNKELYKSFGAKCD